MSLRTKKNEKKINRKKKFSVKISHPTNGMGGKSCKITSNLRIMNSEDKKTKKNKDVLAKGGKQLIMYTRTSSSYTPLVT